MKISNNTTTLPCINNSNLICSLENAILNNGDFAYLDMLEKEYEKALINKGFNLARIYQLNDGTYKTKAPKQLHKKKRIDILKDLYDFYYGNQKQTFKDIYNIWIGYFDKELVAKGHRSPDTLASYIRYYNSFIAKSDFELIGIDKIRKSDLKKLYVNVTSGQQVSRKTLNNLKTLINAVFEYASSDLDMDVISPRNIETKSLKVKEVDNSDDVYTKEEQSKLMIFAWSKLNESVYARAISLMGRLDVRIGEIKALKWDDVNWEERKIYIHDQLIHKRVDGKIIEAEAGYTKNRKESGNRYQPLTSQALEVLKLQKQLNQSSDYIFITEDGMPLKTDSLDHALARYCKAINIQYRSSHKLRFFANSEALVQGASLEQMQKMSGHDSISMTKHYDRRSQSDKPVVDVDFWESVTDVPNCTLD